MFLDNKGSISDAAAHLRVAYDTEGVLLSHRVPTGKTVNETY